MLTVITGPPCAGKTTYAQQHRHPGDITLDFDAIAQALGSEVTHGHDDPIAAVTLEAWKAARYAALAQHGKAARIWIIDSRPTPARLTQYRNAGARIVALDASTEELHRRAQEGRPSDWHNRIDQWTAAEEAAKPSLETRTVW